MSTSSLADRLRGIVRPAAAVPAPPGLEPISADAPDIEEALGGAWCAERRTFVVERRYEGETTHGRAVIGEVGARLARSAESGIALLANGTAGAAPFVFFDLETTGLNGGAGTYAFLVGLASFDRDALVTRQYLLVDYAAERRMLDRAGGEFGRAGCLVSFNGKSFDAPMLDTRYLFHRTRWPGAGLPHVDALHASRRFWRHGPAGPRECSLVALEEEILGVRRMGDVPGFEIPARYFAFVRSGDARPLAAVLEHNRLDLLSLAALVARLLELVDEGVERAESPWEALALGRAYAVSRAFDRAVDGFERAVAMGRAGGAGGQQAAIEALRALALLLRRARRFDEAASAWRRLLAVPSCPALLAREANEALAIHHEHRVRDLAAARAFALQSLGNGRGGNGHDAAWSDAVRHRLQRLERKMTPPSGRGLFPSSPLPPSCGSRTSAPRTSS